MNHSTSLCALVVISVLAASAQANSERLLATGGSAAAALLTAAYVDLGNIATHSGQTGWYIALQGTL